MWLSRYICLFFIYSLMGWMARMKSHRNGSGETAIIFYILLETNNGLFTMPRTYAV